VFIVKKGLVLTPHTDYCLPGITRAVVLEIAREDGIPTEQRRLSLTEVHTADEMFTTGTMGELVPVYEVDGRTIGEGAEGPVTARLKKLFAARVATEGERLPF
jgi:branched-subunit amino acid aminotransferase/4-amino-4-deoxychorismate lyase